jgi:ABC-type antimicrobial peptide transport system permease subunit
MSEFSARSSVSRIGDDVMTLLSFASLVSFSFAVGAIGIIAYSDAKERRRLDALFRIRGLRRSQILNLIMSEALTFFFFSLLIGLLAGFVMASGYSAYFSATFPIRASPIISPILLVELFSLLAVYLLVFLMPSALAMRQPPRFHNY